jgi:PPK2 family polyphosphate:nucleotide phosphotransferase
MSKLRRLSEPYKVDKPAKFRLKHIDPRDTHKLRNKEEAEEVLLEGIERLKELQERLYAQDKWGVLLVFQAMDAAGKDGTIEHVMSGVNPQGCQVYSFKAPSPEEVDHDFMWRTTKSLPERGRIGIFNRSYYEETLVVRVHPELLEKQRLPRKLITKRIWSERFEDINAFERYLARNGYLILKFFLHVSNDEQRDRFLSRLNEPKKNWKFSLSDAKERHYWNEYMAAYEDTIRHTSTPHAPWFVVPADNKWFTRAAVAAAIVEALEKLDLKFPQVDEAKLKELDAARVELGGSLPDGDAEAPAAPKAAAAPASDARKKKKKKDKKKR